MSNPTMSDSDVFIISVITNPEPAQAIRQAIQNAGADSLRIQDAIFGLDELLAINADEILSASSLTCSAATVSSSLRAAFFAAQSILSFDVDIVAVVSIETNASTALLLASADAVGRWNLMPRARLAARSLNGVELALRGAEIELKDVTITKNGRNGAVLIKETLDELEEQSARWGMITVNELVLLIERL